MSAVSLRNLLPPVKSYCHCVFFHVITSVRVETCRRRGNRTYQRAIITSFCAAGIGTNTHAADSGYKVFPGIWQLWWTWWMKPKCRADVYSEHLLQVDHLMMEWFWFAVLPHGDEQTHSPAQETSKHIKPLTGEYENNPVTETPLAEKRWRDLRDLSYSPPIVSVCSCVFGLLLCTRSFAQQGHIVRRVVWHPSNAVQKRGREWTSSGDLLSRSRSAFLDASCFFSQPTLGVSSIGL